MTLTDIDKILLNNKVTDNIEIEVISRFPAYKYLLTNSSKKILIELHFFNDSFEVPLPLKRKWIIKDNNDNEIIVDDSQLEEKLNILFKQA